MMRKVCANTGKVSIDGTSKRSAQGYVVFESIESVDVALSMNNMSYENHTLRVDGADPTVDPSRSVFVGNLPYGADEETLREHFGRILTNGEDLNEGEGCAISGVRIVRDGDTQKCKGFGYVTLRDGTLISSAMRAHGTTYMKRELRVMICGKRFKGKRGGGGDGSYSERKSMGRRSFEGRRATTKGGTSSSTGGEQSSKKRKISVDDSIADGGATRRRRARSEKRTVYNSGTKPSGLSKRAASAQKANKRVKKLQNRVVKGMGKKKL
jgi:nucleolar protein 12